MKTEDKPSALKAPAFKDRHGWLTGPSEIKPGLREKAIKREPDVALHTAHGCDEGSMIPRSPDSHIIEVETLIWKLRPDWAEDNIKEFKFVKEKPKEEPF